MRNKFLHLGVLAVLRFHPSILPIVHYWLTANLPGQPDMVLMEMAMLVTEWMTRLMVDLVSLVVKLVRWLRPFLFFPDFQPQPRLFTHLAHLLKQGEIYNDDDHHGEGAGADDEDANYQSN